MPNQVQVLKSSTPGVRPAGRLPGELYVNWADNQLGVINASNVATDLLAVRFYSVLANYVPGNYTVYQGVLYSCILAANPGAFNPANWAQVGGSVTISDTPPALPQSGQLWFDSVGGQLYVWYVDPTSSQWVIAVSSPAGIPDAPSDGTTYARNSGAWVHLAHTDITDWTTALAPYALITSVPLASSTTPLMDGTAAIGNATTWARANHVHPTDTSRAAASALGSYLPLVGGTITGSLGVNGNLSIPGGQIVMTAGPAGGVNPVLWMSDGSTNRTVLYFQVSSGQTTLQDQYSGVNIQMGPSNVMNLNAANVDLSGSISVPGNGTISGTLTTSYITVNGTLGVASNANVNGGFTCAGVIGVGSGGGQLYWDGGSYCYHTCPPYSSNIGVGANISLSPQSGANMLLQVGHGYQAGGGSWVALSDERIKTVDSDYTIGLEEVLQLRPVNYTYKGNDTPTADKSALRVEDIDPENPNAPIPADKLVTEAPYPTSMHYHYAKEKRPFVGLVAQEVEKVFPGMVREKDGFIDGEAVTDMRHLDTTPLIFALINSVKTLTARITQLEAAR
jgi:hypothetical protein